MKWKGYPEEENSWEPSSNLNCSGLLEEYKLRNNLIPQSSSDKGHHKPKSLYSVSTSKQKKKVEESSDFHHYYAIIDGCKNGIKLKRLKKRKRKHRSLIVSIDLGALRSQADADMETCQVSNTSMANPQIGISKSHSPCVLAHTSADSTLSHEPHGLLCLKHDHNYVRSWDEPPEPHSHAETPLVVTISPIPSPTQPLLSSPPPSPGNCHSSMNTTLQSLPTPPSPIVIESDSDGSSLPSPLFKLHLSPSSSDLDVCKNSPYRSSPKQLDVCSLTKKLQSVLPYSCGIDKRGGKSLSPNGLLAKWCKGPVPLPKFSRRHSLYARLPTKAAKFQLPEAFSALAFKAMKQPSNGLPRMNGLSQILDRSKSYGRLSLPPQQNRSVDSDHIVLKKSKKVLTSSTSDNQSHVKPRTKPSLSLKSKSVEPESLGAKDLKKAPASSTSDSHSKPCIRLSPVPVGNARVYLGPKKAVVSSTSENTSKSVSKTPVPRLNLVPSTVTPSQDMYAYKEKLMEWQYELNRQRGGTDDIIYVENDVDTDPPPTDFIYVCSNVYAPDVPNPSQPDIRNSLCGCECYYLGRKCGPKSEFCCANMAGFKFAYTLAGKVRVPPGTPIYECNAKCSCPSDCANRVVQLGRKIPLCIFRTAGRGWGVKAIAPIKANTFITEYVGEVITNEEAEKRGKMCDACGITYLFDLDFEDENSAFTIDAAKYGNISHFFNHSVSSSSVALHIQI